MRTLPAFALRCFAILLLFASACNNQPDEKAVKTPVEIRYPDKGDFRALYPLFRDRHVNAVISQVRQSGMVQQMLDWVNASFNLPQDMIIHFNENDTINAFYNPATKYIEYESGFINYFYQNLYTKYREPELSRKAMNTVIFFLFHEMGHAFIDMYHLTVRGPEEDMADYFAVYLLSQGNEATERALLDGAEMFYYFSNNIRGLSAEELDPYLWDEHALDKKRYYNIISLLYGKDPQRYASFVTNGLLPFEKTAKYQDEYRKMMQGWQQDLQPYFKH